MKTEQATTETTTNTMPSDPNLNPDPTPNPDSSPESKSDNVFRGINISGDVVTKNTESYDERERSLLRWLYSYARQENLTWDDLTKQVKVDSTTLYRIWQGKYKHPQTGAPISPVNVCEKIERYKKNLDLRADFRRDLFVKTSTWERIEWLCDRAYARQTMGFIWGESRIGKTTSLQEYQRRHNHGQTTYVEMPPAAGVQLMTKTLARALFVSDKKPYETLIEDVVGALDESKLLVIDEIHRVFTTYQKGSVMRCLDVLRSIHDRTKCGMVLCGTHVFRDQLKRGEFAQYLKQFRGRARGYELQLPTEPPRADLDLIAAEFGLKPATGEAEEIMRAIAKDDGFGVFVSRLQDAHEFAAKKKQPLTWEHFIKAHNIVAKMSLELK